MEYRRMGRTGLKLQARTRGGRVTFGAQVDQGAAVEEPLHKAYDLGGELLRQRRRLRRWPGGDGDGKAIRACLANRLVISSKVFWPTMPGIDGRGLSRETHLSNPRLMPRCSASAWTTSISTSAIGSISETTIEETVRAMDDLVHQGKVIYWGTSEWRAPARSRRPTASPGADGRYPPMVEQPHYNMLGAGGPSRTNWRPGHGPGAGDGDLEPTPFGAALRERWSGIPKGSRFSLRDYGWLHDLLSEENLGKAREPRRGRRRSGRDFGPVGDRLASVSAEGDQRNHRGEQVSQVEET